MGRDFARAAAMGMVRSMTAPFLRRNSTISMLFSKVAAHKPWVRYSGSWGLVSTRLETFASTPERHACANC